MGSGGIRGMENMVTFVFGEDHSVTCSEHLGQRTVDTENKKVCSY